MPSSQPLKLFSSCVHLVILQISECTELKKKEKISGVRLCLFVPSLWRSALPGRCGWALKSVFAGSLGCGNLNERRASGIVICANSSSPSRSLFVSALLPPSLQPQPSQALQPTPKPLPPPTPLCFATPRNSISDSPLLTV